jgi:hypothetical protein
MLVKYDNVAPKEEIDELVKVNNPAGAVTIEVTTVVTEERFTSALPDIGVEREGPGHDVDRRFPGP